MEDDSVDGSNDGDDRRSLRSGEGVAGYAGDDAPDATEVAVSEDRPSFTKEEAKALVGTGSASNDSGGRFVEGETEDEVDASLREALLVALEASEEQYAKRKSAAGRGGSSRLGGGRDDLDRTSTDELRDVKWTHQVGVFRDLWIEKRYDSREGKWRAQVKRNRGASSSREEEEEDNEGSYGVDAPADDLVREIARLRRKLRLQQQELKPSDDTERGDIEIGLGPVESIEEAEQLDGRANNAARPGAFRVRGTGEDGEIHSDDDYLSVETVPPRPSTATALLQPPTLASQRSDAVLLEADLVVEQEGSEALLVNAEPIRRRRQALAVAGLVMLTAIIVGTATGVILSRRDPPSTPDYPFVSVSLMRAEFNALLPNSTLAAINRGSTPQAEAYSWLLDSGDHLVLPKTEALPRMLHRFALATLFYSTGGNNSWISNTGWLDPAEHECLWHGVDCTSSAVSFCTNDLGIQIHNVTTIKGLDLSGNGLERSLPGEIGLLRTSNITSIHLESNALEGAIPPQIQGLTSLQALSLIRNKLDGSVQSTLGRLRYLESLLLSENKLTGSFPVSLTNLAKLKELDLSLNILSKAIPSRIGLMTSMVTFALSRNDLTGSIPSEVSRLTHLTTLDLSGNLLSLSFPDGIGIGMRNLQVLALSEIRSPFFGGDHATNVPTQIGEFVSLTRLELSSSKFSGPVPSELGRLEKLEYLLLDDNDLTGPIPTEVGKLRKLIVWDTSKNRELGFLRNLSISDTSFSGTIPLELGLLTSLEMLSLSNTSFSGTIPTELGQLTFLISLLVSDANLTGTIPTELGQLTLLEQVDLTMNRLNGTLPFELSGLTHLTSLRLSDNSLTGSIPSSLAMLPYLKELWLDGNQFNGSVPSEVCEMMLREGACNDDDDDLYYCDSNSLQLTIDCDRVVCPCQSNCTCGGLPVT